MGGCSRGSGGLNAVLTMKRFFKEMGPERMFRRAVFTALIILFPPLDKWTTALLCLKNLNDGGRESAHRKHKAVL